MSLYTSVQQQIEQAYAFLSNKYNRNLLERILRPDQVIEVSIPVMMDDGRVQVFWGYRSQHNNARGPYKGGIRFHPNVTKDEVMSLSARMTLKTSVVGLPLGGGKGGISVDPKSLSLGELERLSRGWMQKMYKHLGPNIDVPAPDVNTNSQIMAWMVDEYSKLVGTWTPGVITGKPLALGGSLGRDTATAQGGYYVLEQYLTKINDTIKGKTIAIQGAGNAGLTFAKLASLGGANVVAISDSKGGIMLKPSERERSSLDIPMVEKVKNENKSVVDMLAMQERTTNIIPCTNEELLELPVDILVPAALENVITKANANAIQAKIILELANGPTTPEADEVLFKKGIVVIPDVLANAGGVTVSYFEQVQNNTNYYWSLEEVQTKLGTIMKKATDEVVETAKTHATSLRMGAYVLALEKIFAAMKAKGL